MNSIKDIPEAAFTMIDLLQQIDRANDMIAVHEDDQFMVTQYQNKKAEFVEKLQEFLSEYKLKVSAA